MREASYYHIESDTIRCELCPKRCVIRPGQSGFCRARVHRDGKLYAQNYGACTSYALDPIEKKPLYHFYPGGRVFSIGSWGCNFHCRFCQNWNIAQANPAATRLLPEQAVALAGNSGGIGIAYTYSEPNVWYEFVLDTAQTARQAGLKNVMVTNGFINQAPLDRLLDVLDAVNIDVKAFTETFYEKMCSGTLASVKETVLRAAACCHVEVTTLIIPGWNDSWQEIASLAAWLASVNPNIPLHLSRYFPNYQLDIPPTPLTTMRGAHQAAREYLRYVYLGNMGFEEVNTYCPDCGSLLIDRLNASSSLTEEKQCPKCGQAIPIIGEVLY